MSVEQCTTILALPSGTDASCLESSLLLSHIHAPALAVRRRHAASASSTVAVTVKEAFVGGLI